MWGNVAEESGREFVCWTTEGEIYWSEDGPEDGIEDGTEDGTEAQGGRGEHTPRWYTQIWQPVVLYYSSPTLL
jgi:hypothetical protein